MGKTIAGASAATPSPRPITSVYSRMQSFIGGDARVPFAYAAGLALPGVAWLLSSQFPTTGAPHVAFVIFSLAVAGSAAIGGYGPALLAAAASLLALDYFFVLPAGAFKLPTTPSELAACAAFGGVALLAAWMSRVGRRGARAEERARAADAALDAGEHLGPAVPALEDLKGNGVLLFFWAHWCPDCKTQAPVIDALLQKYRAQGLRVVAPTQRFGYIVRGTNADPDAELRHIAKVRDQSYPFLRDEAIPVGEANHLRYGVSTTPTLALVDRQGIVRLYRPGNMTEADLDAAIRKLL